jgi:hypothetical protein
METIANGTLPKMVTIDEAQVRSHLDQVVRESVEQTRNELLDAEADRLCRAGRYERSAERVDTRAGSYSRSLDTKAVRVELKVPRLRTLPFETEIIERYRRRQSSVEEALVEMYLAGVSVRRVEDITEALWGTKVSPSTLSELNQKIYATIDAWRTRPIAGTHPYVFLDGIWLKRSWGGEVKTVAVLVAIGVNADGHREILGVCEGGKEDAASWKAFLRHLKDRGLQGVLHGAHLPQRVLAGADGEGEGSRRDAESDPCPGGSGCGVGQSRASGSEADRDETGRCCGACAGERSGDAGLHGLPARALDTLENEQHAGTTDAGDPPADAGGGQLPRRSLGPDAGGGAAAARGRHAREQPTVFGHGANDKAGVDDGECVARRAAGNPAR